MTEYEYHGKKTAVVLFASMVGIFVEIAKWLLLSYNKDTELNSHLHCILCCL